jgi:serine/threonine protein kinase
MNHHGIAPLGQLAEASAPNKLLVLQAADADQTIRQFYLPLENDMPILLGTGRNAVVFLAATSPNPTSVANEYRAVKFLKNDIDQEYAHEAARRFFDEAEKAKKFGRLQKFFVQYDSIGFIADIDERWRRHYSVEHSRIRNAGERYEALRSHFFLQGPFYVLELCHGTIQDLLDKNLPWSAFSIYRTIAAYRESLRSASAWASRYIEQAMRAYMIDGPDLSGMSGYDILNAFKDEPDANSVRNFAVLDLFEKVTTSVRLLHAQNGTLAHRDLKPGNIFIWHAAEREEITTIGVKLADLGHVANLSQLEHGDVSLRQTWRSPGALIPGSQFFRAPEQMDLPIEVRVDVEAADRSVVVIRSRKIGDVQPGDWLSIGDFFSDLPKDENEDASLFKILAVEASADARWSRESREIYRLRLDHPVELGLIHDLQAHIIKATGYHTDGFSLGAMLYDLASGGKNPEHFYTYCLMNFTRRFARRYIANDYSIDDVLDVLMPADPATARAATMEAPLRLREKWEIVRRLFATVSVDGLISAIIELSLNGAAAPPDIQDAMRHYRFRHFHLVSDLLRDYRGVPIPRGILAIIVRCMLRDLPGCYYTSDQEVGFLSIENQRASERIHRDVLALMGQPQYQPPRSFPQILQSHLLFKLRAFALSPGSPTGSQGD